MDFVLYLLFLIFDNSAAAFEIVIYRLNFYINRMFDRKWAGNIEIISAFDLDEWSSYLY